jgi:hypothetical protein
MQTVSSSFTAVGVSSEITIDPGQTVAYALSGTFAGTLALQRSDDGGATWKQVASATAAASGSYTNETLSHERVRWACLAYTSGTAVALIAKIEELLGVPQTTVGIGAGNGSTVFVKEYGNGLLHKTIITCVRTPVTITDDAGVAQYGGAGKLYTFPQGLINTLGAVL